MNLDKALNFLFPSKCRICFKKGNFEICDNCIRRIKRYEDFHFINYENSNFNRYLNGLIYFFKYEQDIRKMILDYKFFNKYYYGKVFSKLMTKNENFCRILKFYDIIIPVPMYKTKKLQRGYNQSEILAENLAKELNIRYENGILRKNVNNKRQSSLSKKERFQNVKNVFKIENSDKIRDKNIVLIDDICTTSATLEECSKVLKVSGAKKVIGVVIAKD